jgi:hypothetical protein
MPLQASSDHATALEPGLAETWAVFLHTENARTAFFAALRGDAFVPIAAGEIERASRIAAVAGLRPPERAIRACACAQRPLSAVRSTQT